jgi:hypothetical protein
MPAAILGDRASGKTTFLGLLYAAQVKYGTKFQDTFRFHAPPDSLKVMSAVYEGMKGGNFPGATLKDEITELSFIFGYRGWKGKFEAKLPQALRERLNQRVNPFFTLEFGVYDVSGEDVEEYIESGVAASPIIQQLLKSVIIVILVDCSKMTKDIDSPAFKKMVSYDTAIAKLLVNFQTYKKQEYERQKSQGMDVNPPVIYPVIVLAKHDMISDEILSQLGLHREAPPASNFMQRRKYAETLLGVFLKQSLSQLKGGRIVGVNFDQSAYFCSWIHTETAEGMATPGKPRIVRKKFSTEGVGEPDFSYDEYVAFIEHFRDIAKKMPDDVEEKDKLGQGGAPSA